MNEWLKKMLERIKTVWGKWSAVQKVIFFGILGGGDTGAGSSCRL